MMRKFFLPLTATIAVLSFTSCGTNKNLYTWHNYEDVSYKYSKKVTPELEVKLLDEYRKLTDKQKGLRGVVPPGLYAEYGFLLYKTGKKEEGLAFLKKEIELYPESTVYISRIIKQIEQ